MRAKTQGFGSAQLEKAAENNLKTVVIEEISEVADLLNDIDIIQQVLLDPSIEAVKKKNFISDLLLSKVNEITLDVVSYVILNELSQEVTSALKELGIVFEESNLQEINNQVLAFEGFCSRQAARDRYEGYINGVCSDLSAQELEELEDAVFRFARILESSAMLRGRLNEINITPEAKVRLVSDLIQSKVGKTELKILTYPLRAGRQRDLVVSLDLAAKIIAGLRGKKIAYVQSAIDLTESDLQELSNKLESLVGNGVEVRVTKNPEIIGGLKIQVADFLIDRTVKTQLEQLKQQIVTLKTGGNK